MSISTRRRIAIVTVAGFVWFGTAMTGSALATPGAGTPGKSGEARNAVAKNAIGKNKASERGDTAKSRPDQGSTVTPKDCPNTFHHVNAGKGANTSGAYDSTCDGTASQNGNGSGDATGKPCAGCVGNADFKNPKGQAPNGSDRNKGYECDANKGIGKGNPAHSGCTSTPTTTAPTSGKSPDKSPSTTVVTPTTEKPAEVLAAGTAPATTPPQPVTKGSPVTEQVEAAALASTGASVANMVLMGSALLLMGLAATAELVRRRSGFTTALLARFRKV